MRQWNARYAANQHVPFERVNKMLSYLRAITTRRAHQSRSPLLKRCNGV